MPDKSPACLENRLREAIGKQLECSQFTKQIDSRDVRLVPVVGNGLTRMAADLPGQSALSWDEWIKRALEAAGKDREIFDSLRLRGYDHPEILSYAFSQAQERDKAKRVGFGAEPEIWKLLWENVSSIDPSPVHKALVHLASDIITSNYDDLIEEAAAKEDSLNWDVIDLEGKHPGDSTTANGHKVQIYKIHGSMPGRKDVNGFRKWLEERKHDKYTITTAQQYRKNAFGQTQDLRYVLSQVQSLLDNNNKSNVFLFLGTGLSSAELVLFRLLSPYNRKNCHSFVIGAEEDPLLRLDQLGVRPIRVPIGLAASSERRALAHLILLDLMAEHLGTDGRFDETKKRIKEALKSKDMLPFANLAPVVVSMGQLASARVIGLEEAAQQERFHPAVRGTVGPDGEEAILIVDQQSGQAGTPALVWDALGLPCALVSEIGDDAPGKDVMGRLERTKWVNFEGVRQIIPKEEWQTKPDVATENYVCTTWFGVRTGYDSWRFKSGPRNSRNPGLRKALQEASQAPILYLTSVFYQAMRQATEAQGKNHKPLILFETGSSGNMKAEEWVASQEGIILASARVASAWYVAGDAGCVTVAQQKAKACISGDERGDEYGRYRQLCSFLVDLETREPLPLFLKAGLLANARAFVVTLGEVGCVYWYRGNDGWSDPFWCVSKSFIDEGSVLPPYEIRDALGCGDCARAGFVYGLYKANEDGIGRRGTIEWTHMEKTMHYAVACLNWFGLQKIRFFGLERYIRFLRESRPSLEAALKHGFSSADTCVAFGADACDRLVCREPNPWDRLIHRPARQDGRLDCELQKYKNRIFRIDPRTTEIDRLAKKWQEERRFRQND